ncbi:hypothetical protein [Ochrobactrum teleogrylli]
MKSLTMTVAADLYGLPSPVARRAAPGTGLAALGRFIDTGSGARLFRI